MQVNLIEVKVKIKKSKVILLFVLIVFIIVLFSILGIYAAKIYNQGYIQKRRERNNIQFITSLAQNNENKIINQQQEEQTKQIPQYTENAKKNLKNIYNSEKKIAYLTFDDGPSKAVTPLILDLLKQENIKATFFVLGRNVDSNPDILRRTYEEGHYIANHGYSHEYSKIYESEENVLKEYNKTEKSIQKALNISEYSTYLFRFPGGSNGGKYSKIKHKAKKLLNENNISYMDWNSLTRDAEGTPTKESIIKNLKATTKDKNAVVILMHDTSTKILTYETLSEVIKYLREEGYEFDNFYNIMK